MPLRLSDIEQRLRESSKRIARSRELSDQRRAMDADAEPTTIPKEISMTQARPLPLTETKR